MRTPPISSSAIPVVSLEQLGLLEAVFAVSKDAYTIRQRQLLAWSLFIAHRDGIKDENDFVLFVEDERLKAEYYLAQALLLTPDEIPSLSILNFLARGTSSRLAIVRLFRLHPLPFLVLTTSTGILFNALQLSYFVEFAFCFTLLMEKSLRPKANENEWWFERVEGHRFKEAFLNREFLNIFTNTVIWGVVNGVCYFDPGITPATRALWNLGGFFLDVIHDWGFARLEVNDYTTLQTSIEKGTFTIPRIDLKCPKFQANLAKKIEMLKFKETRLTIAALLIFVGMILVFAPALVPAMMSFFHLHPLVISGLMKISPQIANTLRKIGANVVILGGVCIASLGGRLFWGDLNWNILRSYKFDKKTLTAFYNYWFNKKTFNDNIVRNLLVPMGSMGVLMVIALLSSPAMAITAGCFFMAAWFFMMKMNYSFLPPCAAPTPLPPTRILEETDLQNIFVDANSDEFNVDTLMNLARQVEAKATEAKTTYAALPVAAGMNQMCFLNAVREASKQGADERQSDSTSTKTITQILDFYKKTPASILSTSRESSSEEATPSAASSETSFTFLRERQKPKPVPLVVNSPPNNNKGMLQFLFGCCFGDGAKRTLTRHESVLHPQTPFGVRD